MPGEAGLAARPGSTPDRSVSLVDRLRGACASGDVVLPLPGARVIGDAALPLRLPRIEEELALPVRAPPILDREACPPVNGVGAWKRLRCSADRGGCAETKDRVGVRLIDVGATAGGPATGDWPVRGAAA